MQYAQRFFRPIQDLSEKFNILQSAMAACERIFKLLDEPLPAPPAETPLVAFSAPRGDIRISQRVIRLHGRRESQGGKLGVARRFFSHCTGTNPGHRRPHRSGKNHAHPAAAALLRYSARRNFAGWRGHSPLRRAPIAASVRHRVAGSISFYRHIGIQRPPGRRRHQPRARGVRAARSGSRLPAGLVNRWRGNQRHGTRRYFFRWPAPADQFARALAYNRAS